MGGTPIKITIITKAQCWAKAVLGRGTKSSRWSADQRGQKERGQKVPFALDHRDIFEVDLVKHEHW